MHILSCHPSLCPAWLLNPTETVIHKKEMEFLLPCTSYALDRQWWDSGYRSWITQTQDSALKPHVARGPLGSWLCAPLRDVGPRKVDDLSAIVMGMGLQASSNMCTCITHMCTCTHVPLASLIPALKKKIHFYWEAGEAGWSYWVLWGWGGAQGDSHPLPSSTHFWVRCSASAWEALCAECGSSKGWFIAVPGVAQLSEQEWSISPSPSLLHCAKSDRLWVSCPDRAKREAQRLVGRTAEHKSSPQVVPCWLTLRPWTNCFFLNN